MYVCMYVYVCVGWDRYNDTVCYERKVSTPPSEQISLFSPYIVEPPNPLPKTPPKPVHLSNSLSSPSLSLPLKPPTSTSNFPAKNTNISLNENSLYSPDKLPLDSLTRAFFHQPFHRKAGGGPRILSKTRSLANPEFLGSLPPPPADLKTRRKLSKSKSLASGFFPAFYRGQTKQKILSSDDIAFGGKAKPKPLYNKPLQLSPKRKIKLPPPVIAVVNVSDPAAGKKKNGGSGRKGGKGKRKTRGARVAVPTEEELAQARLHNEHVEAMKKVLYADELSLRASGATLTVQRPKTADLGDKLPDPTEVPLCPEKDWNMVMQISKYGVDGFLRRAQEKEARRKRIKQERKDKKIRDKLALKLDKNEKALSTRDELRLKEKQRKEAQAEVLRQKQHKQAEAKRDALQKARLERRRQRQVQLSERATMEAKANQPAIRDTLAPYLSSLVPMSVDTGIQLSDKAFLTSAVRPEDFRLVPPLSQRTGSAIWQKQWPAVRLIIVLKFSSRYLNKRLEILNEIQSIFALYYVFLRNIYESNASPAHGLLIPQQLLSICHYSGLFSDPSCVPSELMSMLRANVLNQDFMISDSKRQFLTEAMAIDEFNRLNNIISLPQFIASIYFIAQARYSKHEFDDLNPAEKLNKLIESLLLPASHYLPGETLRRRLISVPVQIVYKEFKAITYAWFIHYATEKHKITSHKKKTNFASNSSSNSRQNDNGGQNDSNPYNDEVLKPAGGGMKLTTYEPVMSLRNFKGAMRQYGVLPDKRTSRLQLCTLFYRCADPNLSSTQQPKLNYPGFLEALARLCEYLTTPPATEDTNTLAILTRIRELETAERTGQPAPGNTHGIRH